MKYIFTMMLFVLTGTAAAAEDREHIQDEYYGSPLLPDAIAFRTFLGYFDNFHKEGINYGEGFIAQQFTPWLDNKRSKTLAKVLVKVSAKIKERDIKKKQKILCPEWRAQRHHEDIFIALDSLDSARQRVSARGLKRFVSKLDEGERTQFMAALTESKKSIDYVVADAKASYQNNPDMDIRYDVEEMCTTLNNREAE